MEKLFGPVCAWCENRHGAVLGWSCSNYMGIFCSISVRVTVADCFWGLEVFFSFSWYQMWSYEDYSIYFLMICFLGAFDRRVYAQVGCIQRAMLEHARYRSTHATNCNRLENEVVKWRSPCVWPRLISYNVVFYVMPCSPRTHCSLERVINTLNQTVSLQHPWACVCICVWVCAMQGLFLCTILLFCVCLWAFLLNISWGLCVWLHMHTDISVGNTIYWLVIKMHGTNRIKGN